MLRVCIEDGTKHLKRKFGVCLDSLQTWDASLRDEAVLELRLISPGIESAYKSAYTQRFWRRLGDAGAPPGGVLVPAFCDFVQVFVNALSTEPALRTARIRNMMPEEGGRCVTWSARAGVRSMH